MSETENTIIYEQNKKSNQAAPIKTLYRFHQNRWFIKCKQVLNMRSLYILIHK